MRISPNNGRLFGYEPVELLPDLGLLVLLHEGEDPRDEHNDDQGEAWCQDPGMNRQKEKPGLRIRIHLIRIRIQHFRLNTDPDPIRIQGF
jgi:hypothetical protein